MSATQSTHHSATTKGLKPTVSSSAHAPAPVKATPPKGKPAKKSPPKAAGKTAALPKSPIKNVGTGPAKVASKAVKTVPKQGQPAAKAVKAAPAKTKPASKVAKAGSKQGKSAPKVAKAAPQKAASGTGKADPGKAKLTPETQHAVVKKDPTGAHKATPQVNHPKPTSKEQSHVPTPEKPAPKNDKPEPRREHRAHDDSQKKPVIRRSSLVDFPVPPPPVRPPFVPPKPAAVATEELAPAGVNASHTPAFIQKQRQRLLDLRDDLVDALSGMTRDTIRNAPEGSEASGSGMHQGDAGSDAYDRDFALSVLAKEQDALYEIDQALRRIQKGLYGICEMSNRKIPQARLEAIPFARLTVECQSQWEKEYGNRRFRPSNEVGFSGGNLIEDEDSETVLLDDDEE